MIGDSDSATRAALAIDHAVNRAVKEGLAWPEVLRLVDQIGEHLVAALHGVVGDLGFNPDDPAVQAVIRERLERTR